MKHFFDLYRKAKFYDPIIFRVLDGRVISYKLLFYVKLCSGGPKTH